MGTFSIFITRLLLSFGFSYIICKVYWGNIQIVKLIGLAVILFGFAYLFEYLRKGKNGDS